MKINEIPGIGKKLQEKIVSYFSNNEEAAIKALRNGMGAVVSGISQNQATKFARYIFEKDHDSKIEDVLKNENITEIYNDIVAVISNYFVTDYSKSKMSLYFPLGQTKDKVDIIKERYEKFGRSLDFVTNYGDSLENEDLMVHLKKLALLKKVESNKKINTRVILTDKKEIIEQLKDDGITDKILCEFYDIDLISDHEKFFKSFADTFPTVLIVSNNFSKIPDLMNIVPIDPEELNQETIIPEKIIYEFASNSIIIDGIFELAQILLKVKDSKLIHEFLEILDMEKIRILKENIEIFDEKGEIAFAFDEKLDKFKKSVKHFTGIIVEIENEINEKIKNDINSSSITIEGEKILDLFRNNVTIESVRGFIPSEVEDLINDNIEKGIMDLENKFFLTKNEASWTGNLYPEAIEIPVSLNPSGIDQLEFNIKKRAEIYNYNILKDVAKNLKKHHNYLNELIWNMLEFEFFYGIGKFAKDYGLIIPEIDDNGHGIALVDSFNLYLMEKTLLGESKTVPIAYSLGNINSDNTDLNNVKQSRLNLLSGSNSGGKTMCILTIAHSIILAQMGFPAPGHVKYHPFAEMYFFRKSNGQISAGAFESTLLMFVELAQSPHEKIILADELEAITEPLAAAKVISAIFSLLLENPNNYAVFVTHLIEMLLENLSEEEKTQIRVDGIEAKGLDENLELIIDRSPTFNYIARSTPELILERLSKMGRSEQKDFFKRILKKFNIE